MLLIIDLKPEEAEGHGGEVLTKMGMRRSAPGADSFQVRIPFDPNLPDDYAAAYVYTEALLDHGIIPTRLRLQRAGTRPTPITVSGSVEDQKNMYLGMAQRIRKAALEADADLLQPNEVRAALEIAKSYEERAESM